MVTSTRPGRRAGSNRATYIALTVGLILMVPPFIWMVLSSIKPNHPLELGRSRPPSPDLRSP